MTGGRTSQGGCHFSNERPLIFTETIRGREAEDDKVRTIFRCFMVVFPCFKFFQEDSYKVKVRVQSGLCVCVFVCVCVCVFAPLDSDINTRATTPALSVCPWKLRGPVAPPSDMATSPLWSTVSTD